MTILTAPRLDPLLGHLVEQMRARPLPPLARETVVVAQNVGLRVWLEQALARDLGCVSGLHLPAPPVLSTALARHLVPGARSPLGDGGEAARHPFDIDVMAWRLRAILADLPETADTERLRAYLGATGEGVVPLAGRAAALFDDYQLYRPDVLAAWLRGERTDPDWPDEPWEAFLWRALHEGIDPGTSLDRATSLDALIRLLHRLPDRLALDEALRRGGARPEVLPERLAVFGALLFPPVHLRVLAALARFLPVTVYTVATGLPADLYGERFAADGFAHPLLRSLAERTRDWVRVLHAVGRPAVRALPAPPLPPTALGRLQAALHADAPPDAPLPLDPADRSIRILDTHGPVRELEVLRDHLLDAFDTLPGLRPNDILVVVPDPDLYAPLVDAVFGAETVAGAPLPYHIVEHPFAPATRLFETVQRALRLLDGRLTGAELLSLLGAPAVRRRAGIREEEIPVLRTWIREAGIRWGLDADQRSAYGLPADDLHTWRFGIERLLLGYAAGGDELVLGRATRDVAGLDGADLLGRFVAWATRLLDDLQRLARPGPRAAWPQRLADFLDAFLDPRDDDDQEATRFLRETAQSLAQVFALVGADNDLPFSEIRAHVEAAVRRFEPREPFLTGGITVARPLPLRFVPHRVVAFLGLNDGQYPRPDDPAGFDLMAHAPRPGDPTPRRSAKQLFLDAVLTARDRVILSYAGRSQKDNRVRPASVVLDAFTDTLDRTFGPGAAAALTETHPLQPFDAAYFASGAALFSYAQQHRIEAPAERVAPPPFLTRGALPRAEATDRLALPALADAWARPSAHLTRALRIRLDLSDLALADDEPLAPDHLERYRLRQALAEGLLAGLDESALTDRLRQGGLLPGGAPGQIHLRQAREAVAPLVAAVRACGPSRPLPIEVRLAPPDRAALTVAGTLPAATPRGVIVYRAAPIRARDLVEAWAQHLALCAACDDGAVPIDVPARTYVFGVTGEACHFDAPAPGEARLLLGVLARGMETLRAEPVPLFPGASRAYAEKVPESLRASFVAALLDREREAAGQHDGPRTACRHEVSAYALKEARKVFLGGFGVRGDRDDLPVQLLTRGADPFADEGAARQFGTWAMLLWAPLLRALTDGDRP